MTRHAAAFLVLSATSLAPATPAIAAPNGGDALVVNTEKGAVQGVVADGVENFLDIPYAAPPVGPLRWRKPQPATAWSNVRPAGRLGPYCPQPKNFDHPNGPATDEDCLDLNVQRPIGTRPGEKLPVYVYIHGGGFVTGSGMKDTQEKIVRLDDVVGVSLNYRLGALGFLALPALAGDGETGDYGLLDQQAALGWVRRNIASFGGDPDEVTIGGESAGGWSVCTHMVAPGSAGLFAKAVIQSGSCISRGLSQAEASGVGFATRLGCDDPAELAECLRSKSVADLLAAQDRLYVPTHGTPFLPVDTRDAILAGRFSRVPVMIGSMRDEGRSFSHKAVGWSQARYEAFIGASFGENARAVLNAYPYPIRSGSPVSVAYQVGAVETDDGALGAETVDHGIGGCGDLALTDALARYVPVYAYQLSYRTGPGWYPTPGYSWGAGHAAELTYLYPRHDNGKTYDAFTPAERTLSDELVRYWGAFVIHGDPNVPHQPAWPAYEPSDTLLSLSIDAQTRTLSEAAFRTQHDCALWDRLSGAPAGSPPG